MQRYVARALDHQTEKYLGPTLLALRLLFGRGERKAERKVQGAESRHPLSNCDYCRAWRLGRGIHEFSVRTSISRVDDLTISTEARRVCGSSSQDFLRGRQAQRRSMSSCLYSCELIGENERQCHVCSPACVVDRSFSELRSLLTARPETGSHRARGDSASYIRSTLEFNRHLNYQRRLNEIR